MLVPFTVYQIKTTVTNIVVGWMSTEARQHTMFMNKLLSVTVLGTKSKARLISLKHMGIQPTIQPIHHLLEKAIPDSIVA